jgi:hypothetical protein
MARKLQVAIRLDGDKAVIVRHTEAEKGESFTISPDNGKFRKKR